MPGCHPDVCGPKDAMDPAVRSRLHRFPFSALISARDNSDSSALRRDSFHVLSLYGEIGKACTESGFFASNSAPYFAVLMVGYQTSEREA